jgi:single-stranded DNA-binding protein
VILRMQFAGQITKAEHKMAGDKPLVEVSLCKKHKGRNGGEDTFTWVRVNVWEPAEFQVPKLVKGSFIAGSGEFQNRSYVDKAGLKGVSSEVRCSSFDIEVSDGQPTATPAAAAPRPAAKPAVRPDLGNDEPPF